LSVPPQYPSNFPARIAFVGDFPSTTDVEKGMTLVGSSGNVFNSMLRTANLDRNEFYIGNVFNEPGEFTKRDLQRAALSNYLDRLSSELCDVSPNIIVPLGPIALWAFTGSTSLDSQRGAIQPAEFILPGAKLLPTYHPKFVRAQWKYFSVVTADIIRAYREGAYREIRLPHRELLIEPTISEFRDYMPRLLASDLLAVDIETGWGMVTNIGFAPDREHAINIPFSDIRKPNKSFYSLEDEIAAWKLVKEVLESDVPKLGQNFGAYDAYWLIDQMGIAPRNYLHDTRLIHHALYPELPKDLEFMGASYTEQGAWKAWGRKSQEKRES
jgi:uracil-DNA glycosylase family 4